LLQIHSWQKNI